MPEKPQPRKTGKLTTYLGSEVSKGFCVASESSSYPTPTRSIASSSVLEVYNKGVTYQWLGEDATWVVHKKKTGICDQVSPKADFIFGLTYYLHLKATIGKNTILESLDTWLTYECIR